MKIIFIIDSLRKGGKERRMLALIKSLDQTYQYKLIVLSDQVEYDISSIMENVIFLPRSFKKDPSVFLKIYGVFKEFQPNACHAWGRMPSIYSLPSTMLQNIPLVSSIINDVPPKSPKVFSRIWIEDRLLSQFSFKVLSNTKKGLQIHKISPVKGKFIYNGFDNSRISNITTADVIRKKYNIKTKYVVGMVGALEPRKDFGSFLVVAEQMLFARNDVTFLIVGDGSKKKELEEKVLKEHKAHIKFLGQIEDVESVINVFDLGVLLSTVDVHGEGISNAIMEYMALEKPVIATSAGGNSEIVVDSENGYLVENNDPDETIKCINQLLNSEVLRQKMGSAAQAMVIDQFGIERMRDNFYDLYKECIN